MLRLSSRVRDTECRRISMLPKSFGTDMGKIYENWPENLCSTLRFFFISQEHAWNS